MVELTADGTALRRLNKLEQHYCVAVQGHTRSLLLPRFVDCRGRISLFSCMTWPRKSSAGRACLDSRPLPVGCVCLHWRQESLSELRQLWPEARG